MKVIVGAAVFLMVGMAASAIFFNQYSIFTGTSQNQASDAQCDIWRTELRQVEERQGTGSDRYDNLDQKIDDNCGDSATATSPDSDSPSTPEGDDDSEDIPSPF